MNKRVALITGASRGIGKALAEEFHKNSFEVVGVATRLESFEKKRPYLTEACDVSDAKSVKNLAEKIQKKYGKISVLINNAGYAGSNSMEQNASNEESDMLWEKIININLNGTYYVCRYFLPFLENETGRIINFSSVLGHKGVPDATAYCAAKHGVLGFTKSLSLSVASRKITVNAISPGWTRTDMALGRMKEIGLTEADIQNSVPLHRFIEPTEIAKLVLFISSSEASGITGQSFIVDGGVLA